MSTTGTMRVDAEVGVRSWGMWRELGAGPGWKTKLLTIGAGMAISYQRHRFREEYWFAVAGAGTAMIEQFAAPSPFTGRKMMTRLEVPLLPGRGPVHIPVGRIHRAAASAGDALVIVELQLGARCDENDIERFDVQDHGSIGL